MAYTCSCKVVRDEAVIDAIEAGASTVDDVAAACGAGSDCGGCLPTIEAMLALTRADDPATTRSTRA